LRPHHAWFAVVVLACWTIAGCANDANVRSGSISRSVPNETAYVLPPPGGPAIVQVIERGHANGIQQDIALATDSALPGQNGFRVRLLGPVDKRDASRDALGGQALALTNVGSEMRAAMGSVPMAKSPYFVQNRYGPFGYAVGRSGGDLCLYGWQNLRARPALIGNKGSVDIRLRLCRTGAREAELLAVMYGYTVNAYVNDSHWNPYGQPPATPETLGAASAEIYPTRSGSIETVLPEAAPRPRSGKARAAVQQPKVVEEAPIGPAVPPPPPIPDDAAGTVPPPRAAD
jgi:hypothetical protein